MELPDQIDIQKFIAFHVLENAYESLTNYFVNMPQKNLEWWLYSLLSMKTDNAIDIFRKKVQGVMALVITLCQKANYVNGPVKNFEMTCFLWSWFEGRFHAYKSM